MILAAPYSKVTVWAYDKERKLFIFDTTGSGPQIIEEDKLIDFIKEYLSESKETNNTQ